MIIDLDNIGTMHPFLGESAKNKIALYQLKKSQLDFRIVEYCPHTNDFVDKGISCLTAPLVEGKMIMNGHFNDLLLYSLL